VGQAVVVGGYYNYSINKWSSKGEMEVKAVAVAVAVALGIILDFGKAQWCWWGKATRLYFLLI
jgi:hypothetical protein